MSELAFLKWLKRFNAKRSDKHKVNAIMFVADTGFMCVELEDQTSWQIVHVEGRSLSVARDRAVKTAEQL